MTASRGGETSDRERAPAPHWWPRAPWLSLHCWPWWTCPRGNLLAQWKGQAEVGGHLWPSDTPEEESDSLSKTDGDARALWRSVSGREVCPTGAGGPVSCRAGLKCLLYMDIVRGEQRRQQGEEPLTSTRPRARGAAPHFCSVFRAGLGPGARGPGCVRAAPRGWWPPFRTARARGSGEPQIEAVSFRPCVPLVRWTLRGSRSPRAPSSPSAQDALGVNDAGGHARC